MTTETKVEAVARYEMETSGEGSWLCVSPEVSEDGEWVKFTDHQSALDALRGEVADCDAVIECKNIDIRERDRALQTSSKRIKDLEALIASARRAIGDHHAPNDCYATGPLTGDEFLDLVQCPACVFLAQHSALAKVTP